MQEHALPVDLPAADSPGRQAFTPYQKFVVALLAFMQFTVILDFMILSPLGPLLMEELAITPKQFGLVVSVYAFSAGVSGLLAAGFADRFDRKRFLLFFYAGFIVGTLLCGLAPDYPALLAARIITGLFGGVLASIGNAIVTDLFPLQSRGRVMGFIQTAFASSQVLGIPVGLALANHGGWHMPFLLIVAVSAAVGAVMVARLQPMTGHLRLAQERNPLTHLWATVSTLRYLHSFATVMLLTTGGFMLMPFGSAFSVHNLGLTMEQLPAVYMVTGVCAIVAGPLVGRLSDNVGKYPVFVAGSLVTVAATYIYTHLGTTPLWGVIAVSACMFVGISSRMIPSQALMSAIPAAHARGSFMAVSSSVQQVSGGLAAVVAAFIVVEGPGGRLQRFDVLGNVVILATLITVVTMHFIQRSLLRSPANFAASI